MFISSNAEKFLKVLHLIAASCWMGSCAALLALLYAAQYAQSGAELFGILKSYRIINIFICVYLGAYGSLFTGLAYSFGTNRGFLRHKWVILKWLITLGMIVFGANFHAFWSASMLDLANAKGIEALSDPEFLSMHGRAMGMLVFFCGLFLASILLSVYKPWEMAERLRRQH